MSETHTQYMDRIIEDINNQNPTNFNERVTSMMQLNNIAAVTVNGWIKIMKEEQHFLSHLTEEEFNELLNDWKQLILLCLKHDLVWRTKIKDKVVKDRLSTPSYVA